MSPAAGPKRRSRRPVWHPAPNLAAVHDPATMLTPLDDYPIHQTSQPLAIPASGDPNHYDRFFFNGYTADASIFFAAAFGLYPNRDVIDGAFSVVLDGLHVNVHASGRCPLDRSETTVGPIRVEIVRPMHEHRVTVDAPEHGLRAELTMTARTAPVQEPAFHIRRDTRVIMDSTRLTQFGSWTGWIEVDGVRLLVDGAHGTRDRSWGIRSVGAPVPGPARPPQFYWLWAPVSFDTVCTHMDVNEDAAGARWHESGFVVPVGDAAPQAASAMDYRIEWRPGTRTAAWAEIDLAVAGERLTVRLDPLYEFQMLGIGYLHPEWGHGAWKGELAVGGTRLLLPVDDPLAIQHVHVQALCRAELHGPGYDGVVGMGVLEQLVIGPHQPSGFAALNDGYLPGGT